MSNYDCLECGTEVSTRSYELSLVKLCADCAVDAGDDDD